MFRDLNEAQQQLIVYGLLVVLGPSTARGLAQLIGEEPQTLYGRLKGLMDKGLIFPAGEHYRVAEDTPKVKIENGELVLA